MRTLGLGIALLLAVAACGGSSSTPAPSPTSSVAESPAPSPVIANLTEAIHAVLGSGASVENRTLFAEGMTAQQAAQKTFALGIGAFPEIAPANYSCPPGAHCPYPGEPADEHGYLIIANNGSTPPSDSQISVSVTWISDEGGTAAMPAVNAERAAFQ